MKAPRNEFGVIFHENDFFLTTRSLFAEWAKGQKSYLMENFYRKQRARLNVLMNGSKPEGGEWNFDKDNRLPPPKNYAWPKYLEHGRDDIDLEVAQELNHQPKNYWATTRSGALSARAQGSKAERASRLGARDHWQVRHFS